MSKVKEHFDHDDCPECGAASVPAEGVPDQSLRGCPQCDHVWVEDLDTPPRKGHDMSDETTMSESSHFQVCKRKGRYYIRCLTGDTPRMVRIRAADVHYLMGCGNSFDAACVMDFGCGVFAGKGR